MKNNIPQELRSLPQWVCAGPNKVPLNPYTGLMASPTDPATWGTFDDAVKAGMRHIGFVLTTNDPYCIIDLDVKDNTPPEQIKRHEKILQMFQSYTERSASGKGFHIVIKGRLEKGSRRDSVEIYSSERYMIFTGDIVNNLPITDYSELAEQLYNEMQVGRTTVSPLVELDEMYTDREIYEMALAASNGDKFDQLTLGDWSAMGYTSQSEADFALLAIIAFYTKSNEQVRRLFRMSSLGKRDKAVRDDKYLDRAIAKIRGNEPPPVDIKNLAPPAPVVQRKQATAASKVQLPPGLVGEVAEYIYSSAIRPVPEIALVAALAFVAGLAGRSYNISGTGLNLYLILLAETGAGKEGASSGIDSLVSAVKTKVPGIDGFMGPSAFASGQALIKVLNEKPCFVSILGEFGLTLQQLCDPRANAALVMLKKVLLDLYTKSGWTKVLRPSVYSDTEKNTKLVQAPNVTILGESTPETFFGGLDASHISEGLIPRFSIVEYKGQRPPRNKHAGSPPNPILIQKVADLAEVALSTAAHNTCAHVQLDAEAVALLDNFDEMADAKINTNNSDIEKQLWNRAHLKALKMSALIAVGCDPHAPIVNKQIAEWAIRFVERDVAAMLSKFKSGEIGNGETRHESDIRRAVEDFLRMTPDQKSQYNTPKAMAEANLVPFHYLRRRLRLLAAFKNDQRGAARAIEESLRDMVKAEILVQVPAQQVMNTYALKTEVYAIGATW